MFSKRAGHSFIFDVRWSIRVLSLILCLSMLLSCVPKIAVAESNAPTTVNEANIYLSWMKYLPDDMQISQINMPGTHDSGCAEVTPQPNIQKIVTAVKVAFFYLAWIPTDTICYYLGGTQSMSILSQMNNGMRVFDIRLRLPAESDADDLQMQLCHDDKVDCVDVDGKGKLTLAKCIAYGKKFLDAHPSETLIFELSSDNEKKETNPKILNVIDRYLDPKVDKQIISYHADSDVPKLGDVRGKIVLIADQKDVEYTLTTYEMHYEDYGDDPTGPIRKSKIIHDIIKDAADRDWKQRYFSYDDGSKDVWYKAENCSYPDHKGDPNAPKIIGTNFTPLYDAGFPKIVEIVAAMIAYSYDLKSLASQFWNELYEKIVALPKGYRYGWITMDFPKADFTRKVIMSNFAMPAYEYSITINNVPDGTMNQLTSEGFLLGNVHERIDFLEPVTASSCEGSRIIHTVNENLSYIDIPLAQRITLGGKDYVLFRTSEQYQDVLHKSELAENKPGLYGVLKQTYTIASDIPLVEVKVPRIDWDRDNNGVARPGNMRTYAESIGTLTWKRTTPDGQSDLYSLANTDPNNGPYLSDFSSIKVGTDHTYWDNMYAHLPVCDEKRNLYTYEFVGLTNEIPDSVYKWEYYPSGEPTLRMTLVPQDDLIKGPQFTLVDPGWSHYNAIQSLKQQGIKHQASTSWGASVFNETVTGNNIYTETDDYDTYQTKLYVQKYTREYQHLTHEFVLPQTLGSGTADDPYYVLALNPDHPDRYYGITPIDVEVVWKDNEPTEITRPNSIGFFVDDENAGYFKNVEIKPDDNGNWKLSLLLPACYDGNNKIRQINYTKNSAASLITGYTRKVEVSGNAPSGIHVKITYELVDKYYANIQGHVIWNDGNLKISHPTEDTEIVVLRDGEVMDPGESQQFKLEVDDNGGSHSYRFRPQEQFPIWKDESTRTRYYYNIEPKEIEHYAVSTVDMDVFYTRLVSVSGTIDWENGKRPANTQPIVALLRDGEQVSIQECEDFRYSFVDLPIAGEDGIPYKYSIEAIMPDHAFKYVIAYAQPERNNSTGNVVANATLKPVTEPVNVTIPVQLKLVGPQQAVSVAEADSTDFLIYCVNDNTIPSQVLHLDKSTGMEDAFVLEDLPDYRKTYLFEVEQINSGILPWWKYDSTIGKATVEVKYINGKAVAALVMDPERDNKMTFTNVYRGGKLTVSKSLAGIGYDPDKEFNFRVELTNHAVDGTFGDMTFTDGVAYLSLKGGQSKTAVELPNGVGYTVVEADYSTDGYENDHPEGIIGTISDSTPALAAFTNTRIAPFVFTVIWNGKPKDDIEWTLYAADGTIMNVEFEKTIVSPTTWVYTSKQPVDSGCYVVEKPPVGYTPKYKNVGEYSSVTSRCYDGGTIINCKIPRTGDKDNPMLLVLLDVISMAGIAILIAKRKKEH